MNNKILYSKILCVGAIAFGALSTNVYAQAFSSGVDKPIPRFCTNSCVQFAEQLVVDTLGNATAIWKEPDRSADGEIYYGIIASRYSQSTNSWSRPVRIAAGIGHDKIKMHLAAGPNGQATVVYGSSSSYSNPKYIFMAVRFTPGSGWKDQYLGQDAYWLASDITIGSSRRGDIFLTFQATLAEDTQRTERRFIRLNASTGKVMTYMGGGTPRFDKIIGDDAGGAIGIQSANNVLRVMRLDLSTGYWTDLRTLDSSGYPITQLEANADRVGNVIVMYERHNTANNTRLLRTFRFQKSNRVWSSKSVPSISSSRLYGPPSIHGDRYGNFYSTWIQYSGAYMKTISARYSNSGGVWSKPIVISKGSYHTRDAAVTTDYAGNAIYTWGQRTDTGTGSSTGKTFRTTAVRYSNWKFGWPSVIQDAWRVGYKPYIGADNNGRVIVMWTQNSSIWGVKELRSDRLLPK